MTDQVTYMWGQLISPKDIKRIKKLWGKRIEKFIETFHWNSGYNTGLPETVHLMSTIENDRYLNERSIALEERIDNCIKRGAFTPTSSYYGISVEHNMLEKLVQDAMRTMNKGIPYSEREVKAVSYTDLYRIYKLPLGKDLMKKVSEQEAKVKDITKPVKIYKLKHQYGHNHSDNSDTTSCYQEYHIKGKLLSRNTFVRTGLPFVGKLYQSDKDYFQLYVDDCSGRHWALHNTIHYLVTNGLVELT